MTPWDHARSSAKQFGGSPEDYIAIHEWFDETKQFTGDWTHRALRHHAAGIEECVKKFGPFVKVNAIKFATRPIAEQHVIEDCGFIPTVQDWLVPLRNTPEKWMLSVAVKKVVPMEMANGD